MCQLAQNTLRNAAGAEGAGLLLMEKWIATQGAAERVADDELRPAMGKLAAATGDAAKAQDQRRWRWTRLPGRGKPLTR